MNLDGDKCAGANGRTATPGQMSRHTKVRDSRRMGGIRLGGASKVQPFGHQKHDNMPRVE